MSRGANLSIMGLYNNDDSVFDLMNYPDGFTESDMDCVKFSILTECAELEVLYPNPTVMKNMIGLWSYKELPYWQRIYNASLLEYNPIENYRRNETETVEDDRTEEHSGSDVNRAAGTNSTTHTGTVETATTGEDVVEGESNTSYDEGGNDRTDHNISGYDSNTLVANTEDETYYGKTEETESEATSTTTYGKTETDTLDTADSTTFGKTDTFTHGEKIEHGGTTERTVLAYGNIGVTTSQEMLTQELEIAKIINVVPVIIESFKNRFCLLVY